MLFLLITILLHICVSLNVVNQQINVVFFLMDFILRILSHPGLRGDVRQTQIGELLVIISCRFTRFRVDVIEKARYGQFLHIYASAMAFQVLV